MTSDHATDQPFTVEPGQRKIRSFVLRQGRFSPAQQRAFDELWPRFGLDYSASVRDYDTLFGRSAPQVVEIGFGNGDALRFAAKQDTSRDYIGIEVHAPGVGRLLNALGEDGSDHVRVYRHDAVEVLTHEIADGRPMRPIATVAVAPHGRPNRNNLSMPRSMPVAVSKMAVVPTSARNTPRAAAARLRPVASAITATPQAIVAIVVLGWMEMPVWNQSVSR